HMYIYVYISLAVVFTAVSRKHVFMYLPLCIYMYERTPMTTLMHSQSLYLHIYVSIFVHMRAYICGCLTRRLCRLWRDRLCDGGHRR
ncbi:putative transmembrane protein, partial [Toxoplasma gondii p89]